MEHLIGGSVGQGWVALQVILLYLTVVIGFRLGKRRSLAQMTPMDFVAAIAVGAIVGRVPNAGDASYLSGAVTLVTLLVAHGVMTRLRQFPSVAQIIEHSPRLLVAHGKVLDHELHRCGLTRDDLHALLRQRGVQHMGEVRFVVYEQRGQMSIIQSTGQSTGQNTDQSDDAPELLRELVEKAAPNR